MKKNYLTFSVGHLLVSPFFQKMSGNGFTKNLITLVTTNSFTSNKIFKKIFLNGKFRKVF